MFPGCADTTVSIVVAMGVGNRVIGRDGKMPWGDRALGTDMKRFRTITTRAGFVVMGCKTYESLPEKVRPLPNRLNIILCRRHCLLQGCRVARSIYGLQECLPSGAHEVCVIGGAAIYQETLAYADRMYVTEVLTDRPLEGDVFFPDFDRTKWKTESVEEFSADEKNEYATRFSVLVQSRTELLRAA